MHVEHALPALHAGLVDERSSYVGPPYTFKARWAEFASACGVGLILVLRGRAHSDSLSCVHATCAGRWATRAGARATSRRRSTSSTGAAILPCTCMHQHCPYTICRMHVQGDTTFPLRMQGDAKPKCSGDAPLQVQHQQGAGRLPDHRCVRRRLRARLHAALQALSRRRRWSLMHLPWAGVMAEHSSTRLQHVGQADAGSPIRGSR